MRVAKAIVAGATTAGTWLGTALADGAITGPEWAGLFGVVVAAASVWAAPNGA